MVKRIGQAVSPRSRGRRYWLILACISLVAGMMTAYLPGALAVHDTGAFELDGNATNEGIDDWDNVCDEVTGGAECAGAGPTSGATAVSWVAEPVLNASIFTGGGSKDPIDVDQWAWKDGTGGLPDKSNLLHSFAARYSLPADEATCPNGTSPFDPTVPCDVLFFGSDRFDNSGDAVQGFWFFQNEISLGDQKVGGGKSFNGVHEPGDLLIISEFSNGGGTATIAVYEWDPACLAANNPTSDCGDTNLRLLGFDTGALCSGALPSNDAFCGIVNPGPDLTDAPWSFLDKSGNSDFLNGEFFEGGVNLSTLGLADRCFASLSSETRTSTSTDAVLKDFVLGEFGECESSIVTTPKTYPGGEDIPAGGVPVGSEVQDSAVVTVTGIASWSGTVDFYICGPLAAGVLCDDGGTFVSTQNVSNATPTALSGSSGVIDMAGRYCWRGEFIPSAASAAAGVTGAIDASEGECFEVFVLQPDISTAQEFVPNDSATITVDAGGGALAGTVLFELYVDNPSCTGTADDSWSVDIATGNGNDLSRTVMSSNSTAYTTSATFHWVVTYTSSNNVHLDVTSACGTEISSITIDNNATP